MSKLISIVVPAFNEAANVPAIARELSLVMQSLAASYRYEIIFVNDGSTDGTQEAIKKAETTDAGVTHVEFSRNFGKEIAITAGLNHCNGDAAIIIDADLQHPVALIPKLIEEWEKGFDAVVGVRKKSKSDSFVKILGSKLFYKILSRISETDVMPNSTDFQLIDRKVIDAFNACTERTRITRGLIAWLGFRRTYVEFEALPRAKGVASYSTLKLIKLALSGFVSMSLFPLKIAGYLGVFITLISGIIGVFIFFEKFIFDDPLRVTWVAALAVANLFLVGIILCCLGLIALYVGSISKEVSNRPLYIVRK